MAEERNTGLTTTTSETTGVARATETDVTTTDDEATKAELQRRMEEAREQISHTVAEIRDTVATQYETVRENINDALDWRVQVSRRPAAFSAGALGVGLLLGLAVGGAFGGRGDDYDYDSSDYDYDDYDEELYDYSDDYTPASTARRYQIKRPSLSGAAGAYSAASAADTSYTSSSDYGTAADYTSATDYDRSSLTSQTAGYTSQQSSGPGILERFQGTAAYDKLVDEVSTVGNRLVDELSHTAQTVVIPMLLGKLKDAIGIDLGSLRHEAERSKAEQETGQARSESIQANKETANQSQANQR